MNRRVSVTGKEPAWEMSGGGTVFDGGQEHDKNRVEVVVRPAFGVDTENERGRHDGD